MPDSRGRIRGKVLSYDDDGGKGWIRGEDGSAYSVSFNEIKSDDAFRTLVAGAEVIYMPSEEGGRRVAMNVRPT